MNKEGGPLGPPLYSPIRAICEDRSDPRAIREDGSDARTGFAKTEWPVARSYSFFTSARILSGSGSWPWPYFSMKRILPVLSRTKVARLLAFQVSM